MRLATEGAFEAEANVDPLCEGLSICFSVVSHSSLTVTRGGANNKILRNSPGRPAWRGFGKIAAEESCKPQWREGRRMAGCSCSTV